MFGRGKVKIQILRRPLRPNFKWAESVIRVKALIFPIEMIGERAFLGAKFKGLLLIDIAAERGMRQYYNIIFLLKSQTFNQKNSFFFRIRNRRFKFL